MPNIDNSYYICKIPSMYVQKGCKNQDKSSRLLTLFNALTEEDKDIVISMSDLLVKKHGIAPKGEVKKTGQKHRQSVTD